MLHKRLIHPSNLLGMTKKLMAHQAGYLNDLWRYQINESKWTWMAGSNALSQRGNYGIKGVANSTNVPGARRSSGAAYDSSSQELWLFGGFGLHGSSQSTGTC